MRAGLLLALLLSSVAGAQSRCTIDGSTQRNVRLPSGEYNSFMGGGVVVNCPSKQLRLNADSLESFGDEGRVFLLGNVRYREPRLELDSDFLTYYQRDERIVANGNVDARLPNGSSMRGPTAEYFRAMPVTRPVTRLYSTGRPTISLVQEDSAGKPDDPLIVVANHVLMIGDSLVYAGGVVTATRPEVEARGDSMSLDSEREIVVMLRNPVIEGKGERPFTLRGDRIELTSRNRELRRVVSMGRGRATSDDMTLSSDTIDLRVEDDLLQRAIAFGPSGARANSSTQEISADSIDVRMPGQRMREMYAVRNALAQGRPDSTRFVADTVDWMRGDTIIARFDSTITDTASRDAAELREMIAQGSARSYHHMAPADTTLRRPAINYVKGREILVNIHDGSVERVTVVEQAAGVYLEPRPVAVSDTAQATRPPVRAGRPAATTPRRPPR